MSTILYSEPEGHYLEYGSCFLSKLATESKNKADIKETNGILAFNLITLNKYPEISHICSIGHGQCCVHTCKDMETFIEVSPYHCDMWMGGQHHLHDCYQNINLDKFVGKTLHLFSCATGSNLCPDLVNKYGAKASIGYANIIVIGMIKMYFPLPKPCTLPDWVQDFYTFCDSDTEVERALLEGKTIGEAIEAAKNKYQFYIEKYTTGEWKDLDIAPLAAHWLEHNFYCIRGYGDMEVAPIKPMPISDDYTILIIAVVLALVFLFLKK